VLAAQLPPQLAGLLNTVQGQTSLRLTLHDSVHIVHGLAVAHQ
jgi:hypothetical protein